VALAEDQYAVEELSGQGTEKASRGCVHAPGLDVGAQDPRTDGLEYGVAGRGGATVTPSFASSPWIRQLSPSGFSFARRTTRRAMPGTAQYELRQRGEPGPVGELVPHPACAPPQYRVLMPEYQRPRILRQIAAEHQNGRAACARPLAKV